MKQVPRTPLVSPALEQKPKQENIQQNQGQQQLQTIKTIQLNSLRELLQRTNGPACRISVHNIAYSVTEDDMIDAVNSKGE